MWFIDFLKRKIKFDKIVKANKSFEVISFLALANRQLPNKEKIMENLRELFNINISINNWKEDIGTFDLNNKQVIITLMPAPIDWSELEVSCDRAWYFSTAKEKLEKHKAHLVVSISGNTEVQIDNSILLSKVIAAIINSTNVLAVYWNNSQTIREANEFKDKVINLNYKKLPIELWIDIRFKMNNKFEVDLYTVGMNKLGYNDIELLDSRLDNYIMYILVYELSTMIVSSNIVIQLDEVVNIDEYKVNISYNKGRILNKEEVMDIKVIQS